LPNVLYNATLVNLVNGSIDLDNDNISGMLVTAAYVPDRAVHAHRSDVTNEVVGSGYTAKGMALANKTVTQDNAGNRAVFNADDPVWTASTITARALVLYKNRGGAATADELIGYLDFGADTSSTNGSFTVQFNAVGILTLTGP
jgi:hypothetical protein